MDHSYFVRKIDELGRIVLPIEIRKCLDIKERDSLEISLKADGIFIKKEGNFCIFCNSNVNLKSFNEKNICENCIKKVTLQNANDSLPLRKLS